jgi:hypothetical protein
VKPAGRPPRFPHCDKRGGRPPQPALVAAKKKSAKAPQADVAAVVKSVKKVRLRSAVTALAAFPTRFSGSPQIGKVTEWIMNALVAAGYEEGSTARFQPFPMPGVPPQRNVICRGGKQSGPFALVCAHYDSISEKSAQRAPGADDNASGVAVALEVARIVRTSGSQWQRGVMVAFFGGEEQGLHGSAACAEIAASEHWPIDVVVNLDMVGFGSATPPRIVIEYDQGNERPENDAPAKQWGARMAAAAADYTSLAIHHTDIWNSDYLPFEAKGFVCIGAYDAEENPNYHRTTDAVATLNFTQMTEVAKMIVATLVEYAR